MALSDRPEMLKSLFNAAVLAADPLEMVKRYLPKMPTGKTIVLGAGKASAAMAYAVEKNWDGPLEGLVVTRYGHGMNCEHIRIVEAAHPVPDRAGLDAAREILELASSAGPEDLVLCLISGGGSSLLSLPAAELTFEDKQNVNQFLLRCGASIHEINCVRKHLSAIKGGRLALAAAPAKVVTLLISDVPGDDPSVIASGPTVPDVSTRSDALEILQRYGMDIPKPVQQWLESTEAETPESDHPAFAHLDVRMIATPQMALEAAASKAAATGLPVYILGDSIEGEARDVAAVHAAITKQIIRHGQPFPSPCFMLSGGETTVSIRGKGRGGRNVEFLLALAIELEGEVNVWALAADTDGIDGIEEVAGAVITPDTLTRARAMGLNPRSALDNNDAHSFFEALGDQVITGPTFTNVNDFRVILIDN